MREHIEAFLEMMSSERGSAQNTLEAYENDLWQFAELAGYTSAETLDQKAIESVLIELSEEGLGASSIARKLSTYKQFFLFLYSENIRTDNPAANIEGPKLTSSLPDHLTKDEIDALFEVADKDKSAKGLKNALILELLYASGMRISELVTLPRHCLHHRISSVDGSDIYYLLIEGKGSKERIVPINNTAQQTLKTYLETLPKSANTFLFPAKSKHGHIARQLVARMLKQLALKANIDPAKMHPHILRHSFASHLLNNGMDLRILQELLGHSDIATTQIYTHVGQDALNTLVQTKHPLSH